MNERIDRFGALASTLCAVHCAVCALLPAAFAALGLGVLLGHEAEWVFTLIAVGFAGGALTVGWRKHRSWRVAALLALGIFGLLASRGLEMGEGHHDEDRHDAVAAVSSVEHADDEAHHAEHHEDSEEGFGHAAGTLVGVMAGFVLVFGHVMNLRATRRCAEPCCQ